MRSKGEGMRRTNLRDKVVLLTGAAGGIGRACARELADRGARLLLADIDAAGLAETRALLAARGSEAACFPADLERLDEVDRPASEALAHAGRIDVLYNNAIGRAYRRGRG